MFIKDITPVLELTYEQAMWQMLTHKRKGWGKSIAIRHIDTDLSRFDVKDGSYTTCEWKADTSQVCSLADYPEMCAPCIERYRDE